MFLSQILQISSKKIIGCKILMSLVDNKTNSLWQAFMPLRFTIQQRKNTDLIAMQIYKKSINWLSFNPTDLFENWAAVEVEEYIDIPVGLDSFTITGGLYAKFIYKGLAVDFNTALEAMINDWLVASPYQIDDRPHFMVMQETYSPIDANAEEEVWLPIKVKNTQIATISNENEYMSS